MSKPDGPSLLDEFFASSQPAGAPPIVGGAPPPPSLRVDGAPRRSAPPPPPSLRAAGTQESNAVPPAPSPAARRSMPPPPSKRRARAADPVSVSDDALDADQDIDVEVSAPGDESVDAPTKEEVESATVEPAAQEEAPGPDTVPQSAKPVATIRSAQPTVPGLSPADEVDVAWDAISSGVAPKAEADPPNVEPSEPPAAATAPAPSGAYVDVPTPVVPVDFSRAEREDDPAQPPAEKGGSEEAARAEEPAPPAEPSLVLASESDGDEQTVVRSEGVAPEAERKLEPVSSENDEQTVVRIDAPRGDATSPEMDAVTDPFAAPPPAAQASPPPRMPLGVSLVAPPPPVRSSAPPPARVPSLPPPPSFDRAAAPVPPARRSAPVAPRRSLPPPIARSSATDGAFLSSPAGAAPALAPPSMSALSIPPPPPPVPAPVAAPLPPPPTPPVQSKRPSAPPPPPAGARRSSAPPPAFPDAKRSSVPSPGFDARAPLLPPAATKVGPSENTPTIQVSSISARSSAADFTPTVQIGRTQAAGTRPLPPPARVPSFGPVPSRAGDSMRPKSSSIAPLVDSIPPPAGSVRSRRLILAVAALTFGAVALIVGLRMRTGAVVVTVSSESGGAVRNVVVKVDGVVRCQATPCEVKGLEPGAHLVSASAAGLAAGAERAFSIAPGERSAEHVALANTEAARSELDVSGVGQGLRVFVDGRDLGPPPVAIRDIEPSTHVVRVMGPGNLYQPYEETVKVEPGEARSLGPVRLKLLRGRLSLSAGDGADGARVEVDGRRVSRLPTTLELSADQAHEVTAERRGFADFSEEVVFDNAPDRSLQISLTPAAGVAPPQSHRGSSPRAVTKERSDAPSSSAGSLATLDVTSTPRSNVVINGRPMGPTPLRGVHVPAGPQTIVFVNPDLGRKITSTTVAAGARATVAVKF